MGCLKNPKVNPGNTLIPQPLLPLREKGGKRLRFVLLPGVRVFKEIFRSCGKL
jgi:hypothetical protein